MSILSGFKKVKRYVKLADGYKLLSPWTSSQSVEMDDGTTLEENKVKFDNHIDDSSIHFSVAERTKLSGIATGANPSGKCCRSKNQWTV